MSRAQPPALSWLSNCHDALVRCPPVVATGVATCDTHPGSRWLSARELGTVLLEYATRTADRGRLDQAIALLRLAHTSGPVTGEDREVNSHQLGRALRTRFDRHGDPADLNAAIAVLQQARSGTLASDRDESTEFLGRVLDLLCQCLRRRFEILGRLDDLDAAGEAIAASRELYRHSRSQLRSPLVAAEARVE